jgi:hypothetical protein
MKLLKSDNVFQASMSKKQPLCVTKKQNPRVALLEKRFMVTHGIFYGTS